VGVDACRTNCWVGGEIWKRKEILMKKKARLTTISLDKKSSREVRKRGCGHCE
jgi:hypothetical protein